jgi:hypothetical protein
VILGSGTVSGTPLVVEDVTNGLYPTAHGRQVFYVRGQVSNHSKADTAPAEVKVEVVEGAKVLATGTGWAGASTTPESLYNLTDPRSLEALVKAQHQEAKAVRGGASVPFVVVLCDYPDDLAAHALRLTVTAPPEVAEK